MKLNLKILCRVENTSITPKVYGINMNCAARQCNTPAANGSHSRFKGPKKCINCPACDLYIMVDGRYSGRPIKKGKYTSANYDKLFNDILAGKVHDYSILPYVTESIGEEKK
jgi:hypothetical protein